MRAPPTIWNHRRSDSYAVPEPTGQRDHGEVLNTAAGSGFDGHHALPGNLGSSFKESSRSRNPFQKRKAPKPRRPTVEADGVPVLGAEAQLPPVTPQFERRQHRQQQRPGSTPADVGGIRLADGPMLPPIVAVPAQSAVPAGWGLRWQHINLSPENRNRKWWLWLVLVLILLAGLGAGLGAGVGEFPATGAVV
jgi:hypothetical protein